MTDATSKLPDSHIRVGKQEDLLSFAEATGEVDGTCNGLEGLAASCGGLDNHDRRVRAERRPDVV